MRILLTIAILISYFSPRAQTQVPLGVMSAAQRPAFNSFNNYTLSPDSNSLKKKWSFNKYVGFSTGFGFYPGGNSSVFSVPVGLQVNRRLTNNWYAFAGVSLAPSYFNSTHSFNNPGIYKMNPGFTQFSSKGFGMYSRVEGGLMYVNDDRTFSISGSIGLERSSYPLYPPNRTNAVPQQPFTGTRQQ